MGGFILTLRFEARLGRESELIDAVLRDAMFGLKCEPRVTGTHFAGDRRGT